MREANPRLLGSRMAGLCPGNNESAGKRYSGRRHGDTYRRPMLVEIAWAAIRHPGYLQSLYRGTS